MGFLVSSSMVSQVNALVFTVAGAFTADLPPGLQDGDDVWMAVGAGGSTPSSITAASSGWSRLGAETDRNSPSTTDAVRFCSIWRKTWHTGDPTTVSFTTASVAGLYIGFIVRGGAGITPTTDVNAGPTSSADPTVGAFAPVVTVGDLRIWVVWYNDSANFFISAMPTVTPSDANMVGAKMKQLAASRVNGATSGGIEIWASNTDTGADGAGSTATLSGVDKWFERSILLTDGSSGPNIGKELDIPQAAPVIEADMIQGNDATALESAKGKYFGGAHIF
jgi:hypothetical protein